eukprot:TRINITY_DN2571_c0_g1_i5.p2 TRINITY_DN2571_c0_g1~~TRINITY_DN2571_c0_g1_i5.p2  ORF type:complete len:389 (-),score=40.80 TRINITY_DN2571_c0_g1_i5:2941-3936(-)
MQDVVEKEVDVQSCKLFGATGCVRCVMNILFAQLVTMNFKCVRETGEAVLSKDLEIESDNIYLQQYVSRMDAWSSPIAEGDPNAGVGVDANEDSADLIPLITSQVLLMRLQDLQTLTTEEEQKPSNVAQTASYEQYASEDYALPAFRRAQPSLNSSESFDATLDFSSPESYTSQNTSGYLGTYEAVMSKEQSDSPQDTNIQDLDAPAVDPTTFQEGNGTAIQYRLAQPEESPTYPSPSPSTDDSSSSFPVFVPFLFASGVIILIVVVALVAMRIRYGRIRNKHPQNSRRGLINAGGMPSTPTGPSPVSSLGREAAFLEKSENYGYSSQPPA